MLEKKVVVMDDARPGLEHELLRCMSGFSIVQLGTPRAGCRAIQNANGSIGNMIVAVGDMSGVGEADKAALLQNLWLKLGVEPTKVIDFNSKISPMHLAALIELCAA